MADKVRNLWASRATIAVAVFAMGVHVVYWYLTARHYLPTSDAAQYRELALNVAHGHGLTTRFMYPTLHPTAFRPPLWPLMLGGLWRVTGPSVGAGQALNVALGVLAACLAQRYIRRIGGRAAGLTAGALVALYPPLLANDVTLLSDTLALVLLLAVLIDIDRSRWVRAGIWTGLLVLTKPSAQALVVVVGVWLIATAGWRAAARMAVAAVVVMAPWLGRNWIELGSPVLVTSNGFNLAAMYSEQAQASGQFVDPVFDRRFSQTQRLEHDEVRWDHALTADALRSIRANPHQIVTVVRHNVAAMAEVSKRLGPSADRVDHRNPKLQRRTRWLFWLISAVGVAGIAWRRRDRRVQLATLVCVYLTAASVVVVAPPRLRGPFDLLCCLGAGLVAGRVANAVRRRAPIGLRILNTTSAAEPAEAQPAA